MYDFFTLLSLSFTIPLLGLSLFLIKKYGVSIKIFNSVDDQFSRNLFLGITFTFSSVFLDNFYWGITGFSFYLNLSCKDFFFEWGPAVNSLLRQGLGLTAVFFHLKSLQIKLPKVFYQVLFSALLTYLLLLLFREFHDEKTILLTLHSSLCIGLLFFTSKLFFIKNWWIKSAAILLTFFNILEVREIYLFGKITYVHFLKDVFVLFLLWAVTSYLDKNTCIKKCCKESVE